MSNKGIFEIPLFAILVILGKISESSPIWSHHCIRKLASYKIEITMKGLTVVTLIMLRESNNQRNLNILIFDRTS